MTEVHTVPEPIFVEAQADEVQHTHHTEAEPSCEKQAGRVVGAFRSVVDKDRGRVLSRAEWAAKRDEAIKEIREIRKRPA